MDNYLHNSNIFRTFEGWIGGSCKPSDKGKLTALPHFKICQQNLINVSNMLKFEELPEVNSERWLSLEDLDGEVWKPVVNYEEEYRISNYGRLYTFARNGIKEGKIVKVSLRDRYCRVGMRKNGFRKYYNIHRLVAIAFIDNPNNYLQVDHTNGNPFDNRVVNLRWVTALQNINNPITLKRHNDKMFTLRNDERSKPIYQLTLSDDIIQLFPSTKEAERQTGISKSNISAAARHKRRWATDHWATVKTAGGYKWKFKDD